MTIIEITDTDFLALLRGQLSVRPGLTQPPGGVDTPEVIAQIRELAANLSRHGYIGGHWMMVAGGEVVGLCGFKAPPSSDGEIELGFGVARSRRRRGHASAAVRAVVEATRSAGSVRTIVALTAIDNIASQCVLRVNGFEPAGARRDPDDGDVYVWRKRL